jgi:hypothetical protein
VLLCGVITAFAQEPDVDFQFRASRATPFAPDCNGAPQTGILYVNAEVEPYIAINPRNHFNLVGVWQQDRWSNGGAQGLVTGISFDGGFTWSRRTPPFSRCAGGSQQNGGDYERASDPWVTFSPNGVAHQISLSVSGLPFEPGAISAMLVSRSLDGGSAWSAPITLIRDGDQFFNDKETLTADPTDARYIYAVWDRLVADGGGPTYFARTVDGGETWEQARSIYDPGVNSQTIGNQIVVLPDGVVVNFFTQIDFDPTTGNVTNAFLAVIRSTDKGRSWSPPFEVSDIIVNGASDPETGTPIRDGAILGQIAVDHRGPLYAVWQDARFTNGERDGVVLSRSTDGGITWSEPVRINREPFVQAFTPSVHVRFDGTIGVTYYDLRSNTSDPNTLLTDYWLTRSRDGVTWRESRVTGPFDLAIAPNAGGLFLGDYQGLTSLGPIFVPFFAQTNDHDLDNRTDIFSELALVLGRSAAESDALRQGAEEEEANLPEVEAETAAPVQMTPQLRQRVHESVMRVMQRRIPTWDEVMTRRAARQKK